MYIHVVLLHLPPWTRHWFFRQIFYILLTNTLGINTMHLLFVSSGTGNRWDYATTQVHQHGLLSFPLLLYLPTFFSIIQIIIKVIRTEWSLYTAASTAFRRQNTKDRTKGSKRITKMKILMDASLANINCIRDFRKVVQKILLNANEFCTNCETSGCWDAL